MKFRTLRTKFIWLSCYSAMLVSCKQLPKEVEVDERRELCQYDDPTVFKNSYDAILGTQPVSWRRVSRTDFRLLNYAAGNATEIAVGQVEAGGILANLNRWEREFGQDVMGDLSGLETIEMFGGREAYVIQLEGTFQKKMSGMPVKADGWAVTGVICDIGGGSLVTVKMMGPVEEVKAEQENLMNFARSLRINSLQEVKERSKEVGGADESKKGGY